LTPVNQKILVVEDQAGGFGDGCFYLLSGPAVKPRAQNRGGSNATGQGGKVLTLITLDIDLPDISGLELCRRLKQDLQFVPHTGHFCFRTLCEGNRAALFELALPIISSNRSMPPCSSPASFPTSKPPRDRRVTAAWMR